MDFFLTPAGFASTIGVVVVLLLLIVGYLKAPPDTAYIISGLGKKRILIGKAGWRVPFFERVDKLSLRVMQVDVKTSEAVPTNEFINVSVDGVANIKISSDPHLLEKASEALLGMHQNELISLVTQVLEGNMREIVGSVGLKEMVQDRQGVAKKITENVVPDMQKLGMEVVNFNIQNFKDAAGTIENMGIDNVEQIRKNAQIAKANAQRDISIATANADQESNAVKVQTEKMISEQNAQLAIQRAEMQVLADTKKAAADAAYAIQQESQRKVIEVARVNADIAKKEKESELAEKEISLKERQLDADVRKQADAMKYKAEKEAESDLIRRQRDAEARTYEAMRDAEAKRVQAEALRFSMEQEAEGIRAKGLAEAEAIEKKAEAQRKMGEASILEMYLTALPEVVKNAAAPLAQTDKIVMYGEGNSTKLIRDVMTSADQIVDGMKESTGIDLKSILSGVVAGNMVRNNMPAQRIVLETRSSENNSSKESEDTENTPEDPIRV
ncbi:MAG: SPFH domain-containing protein [Clostridiaceae bacterium]|nr:SPFH domain-containing protein [Clostridiaceae bacterium]